jgi:parvulin-like peptidyl-prolyl isomerase
MAQKTLNSAQKNIPAARVNGVVISQYQVEAGVAQLLKPYADVKGKVRLPQEQQYAARQAVLDNLIMRELLYQEARARGITATEEEINSAMQQAVAEYGSEREFKAMLVMTGSSPDEYRQQLIKDLTVNKMAAAVVEGKRKPVSTEEARKYYDEHQAEMQGPEARWLVHIMVPLEPYAPPEDVKKARARLEQIRCLSPAEFEKRAATEGEDLGYVMRGQLHPILDSVVFSTPAGQISRIVKTEEGLHLILVKEILEAGKIRPFNAAVEKELREKLYEKRSVEILGKFTDGLRKKATIEILDQFVTSRLNMEKGAPH